MASVAANSVLEAMTCSICHDLFSDPRLLSCKHTFCSACLQNLRNNSQTNDCPVCRAKTVPDDTRTLQKDLKASQIVDLIRKKGWVCQQNGVNTNLQSSSVSESQQHATSYTSRRVSQNNSQPIRAPQSSQSSRRQNDAHSDDYDPLSSLFPYDNTEPDERSSQDIRQAHSQTNSRSSLSRSPLTTADILNYICGRAEGRPRQDARDILREIYSYPTQYRNPVITDRMMTDFLRQQAFAGPSQDARLIHIDNDIYPTLRRNPMIALEPLNLRALADIMSIFGANYRF